MSGKVGQYLAVVEYANKHGAVVTEGFPVQAYSHNEAKDLALQYTLKVMKLGDFELRVVGP